MVFELDQEHLLLNCLSASGLFLGLWLASKVISVAQVHLSVPIIAYLCCSADPLQYSIQILDDMMEVGNVNSVVALRVTDESKVSLFKQT